MRSSRHPWIDPALGPGLDSMPSQLANLGDGPGGIAALRGFMEATWPTDEQLSVDGAMTVDTIKTTSVGDHEIESLVLRPSATAGPLPVLYFVHPSGMIIPNCRMGLGPIARWAARFGVAVVSVDYRVAPEFPHPIPVEDVYAGLTFVAENAASLGFEAEQLVVVGISGGGGIAAGAVLMARDRGGPPIAHQMLLCPMLDDRAITASSVFEGVPWDGRANAIGWTALLGDMKGGDGVSPYAAPARATDLHDLPPTYIDVGASEVFRDESIAYAAALAAADVPVELHVFMGGYHGYDGAVPTAEVSLATVAARKSYLRRALGRSRAESPAT